MSRDCRTDMQCSGCPLARYRWRFHAGREIDQAVFGTGSFKSGVAFIGEAPGQAEVAQGAPLVGPTGWWFRNVLADAGLSYDDVWRTNALLCQPPGKGSELKGANWKAIQHCAPSLIQEVAWLIEQGIRVFVPMGNAALLALMPDCPYTITAARGYVFPLTSLAWVVPTLHPSPKNLRGARDGWTLVANDMRKAARIAARGGPKLVNYKRILNPTEQQIRDFFPALGGRPMAVDVENTRDGRLVVLGACDGETTIVVPFLSQHGVPAIGLENLLVQLMLRNWLTNPHSPKWFHNGIHDTGIIEAQSWMNLLPVCGWTLDTMFALQACHPDQRKSLHNLASLYYEGPPWKPAERRTESTESEETK